MTVSLSFSNAGDGRLVQLCCVHECFPLTLHSLRDPVSLSFTIPQQTTGIRHFHIFRPMALSRSTDYPD